MNLNQWDGEVAAISSDLRAIKKFQLDPEQKERLALIALKVAIFQLQGHLSVLVDRLKIASERKNLLPTRQRGLLHWAGVYAERTHVYYFRYIQVLGKQMWLKLLRQRMPGSSNFLGATAEFSDEHLIELSVRQKQLAETETLLKSRLYEIGREKSNLRQKYEDLLAVHANREAASSMFAPFGRNFLEASNHPVITRLKGLFNHLALAARPLTDRYRYVSELHQNVANQTDELIERCRSLVISDLETKDHMKGRLNSREFDSSLRKIQELRQQLDVASELFSTPPPSIHPIMVQKNSNRGKTL